MTPGARRGLSLLGAAAAGAVVGLAPSGLPETARAVAAIGAFGVVLWLTEAFPLHVTGLAVTVLLVVVAGIDAKPLLGAYFDPVIALFLGGFALGRALQRHALDQLFVGILLRAVGPGPHRALLAVIVLTGTISMWMSNTAATAVVLPIAVGLLGGAATARAAGAGAKAFVLGVAYAASIGGLATPVGSPPNPVALRFLRESGSELSFLGWMLRMVPLSILMLLAAWVLLSALYPVRDLRLVAPPPVRRPSGGQTGVMAIFFATVALWITEPLHGIPSGVVGLLPVVLLFGSRLLVDDDFAHLGWGVLVFIGASLALGDAVRIAKLDVLAADAFAGIAAGLPPLALYAALAILGLLLTAFLSNTAGAVALVPPLIPLAASLGIPVTDVVLLAVVGVSADFLVPIGTPPNAMAYETRIVGMKDLVTAGAPLAAICVAAASLMAYFVW